jgi:hypothetical protein
VTAIATNEVAEAESPPPRRFDIALYPIVLGAAMLFQLIAVSGVGVWSAVRPMAVGLAIAALVTIGVRLLAGERRSGGLAGLLAVFAVFSGDPRTLAASTAGIALVVIQQRLLPRLVLPWNAIDAVGRGLTLILSIAVLIQAAQVGSFEVFGRSLVAEGPLRPTRVFAASTTAASQASPDIYVLLLDGYGRSDALKQVFDLDDSAFLDGLRARGLSVSTHALTNYPITVQVVMAMFQMRLLDNIPELQPLLEGTYANTEVGLTHAIVQDNPLFDFLRARDYEIDGIASGFAQLSLREADRFITSGDITELEIALLRRTVLGDALDVVAPDFISSQQRDRINATFRILPELAAERPGHPRFVFAHVPSPHPPWVFNGDGSPRTSPDIHTIYEDQPATTDLTEPQLAAGYTGSVEYLWKPVLDSIDAIDRASASPPVIVVFGDHSSWVGAMPGDVRLRFLPLLAARVPGVDRPLPDDESLVNVFPDLLDPLLGAEFPRVDPAASFMFGDGGYDLHRIDDPNAAIASP